jgi:hypothetical protein
MAPTERRAAQLGANARSAEQTRWTQDEIRVAEAYVSVLDFVSRCAQAVDEENPYYLWDKAGQLRSAADRLCEVLAESDGRPQLRPGALAALVARHGRHYRACRLLHPERRR